MEIEWGLDGTPTQEIFSKLFLVASFHSTTDPLDLKFVLTLECFKNFMKLVWFSSLLELEFKISFELESNSRIEDINESLGGLHFHPVLDNWYLFAKIKYHTTFKIFFLNSRLLEIYIRYMKYWKMCLFEGDVIFLNPYLLCMMESRYMISWSILKIFLNTIQPWIYFSYDIDTLKNVCDFLYDFIWCFIIFLKKKLCMPLFFLPNLDLLELLGVFAAIWHLNECLDFGILF